MSVYLNMEINELQNGDFFFSDLVQYMPSFFPPITILITTFSKYKNVLEFYYKIQVL